MIKLEHVVDSKKIGDIYIPIVRNYFLYEGKISWMTKAQGHFTKDQKKIAKQMHKLNYINN